MSFVRGYYTTIVHIMGTRIIMNTHITDIHTVNMNQRMIIIAMISINALFAGKNLLWDFLDAVLGIVGAVLVARWALGLIRQTGKILLEAEMDEPIVSEIKTIIDGLNVKISDLHVWKVGREKFSCIVAINTENKNITPESIKKALSIHEEIVHATIEINYR